jgi:hypothetical protein
MTAVANAAAVETAPCRGSKTFRITMSGSLEGVLRFELPGLRETTALANGPLSSL